MDKSPEIPDFTSAEGNSRDNERVDEGNVQSDISSREQEVELEPVLVFNAPFIDWSGAWKSILTLDPNKPGVNVPFIQAWLQSCWRDAITSHNTEEPKLIQQQYWFIYGNPDLTVLSPMTIEFTKTLWEWMKKNDNPWRNQNGNK